MCGLTACHGHSDGAGLRLDVGTNDDAPSLDTPDGATPYLTRQDATLVFDRQPYKFAGTNVYGFSGCETGSSYSVADIDRFFASLPPHTATRTWAFQALGQGPGSTLDRVIQSAQAHGQMVIPVLSNGAYGANPPTADCDGNTPHDDAWYKSGYRAPGGLQDWIRTLVPQYRDSPAIAMWEIINEPQLTSSSSATDANGHLLDDTIMRGFFDDNAALIKSLDSNHLVETGTEATYVPGTHDFAYVHGGPDVDVVSAHEYDYNDSDREIYSHQVAAVRQSLGSLAKPLIIGETGVYASDSPAACYNTTPAARALVFQRKFDAYLDPTGGVSGVLIWNWHPTKTSGCTYEVYGFLPDAAGSSHDPLMDILRAYSPPP
jgi:mannan endo-1,4-beta-mannosidase